MKPIDPVYMKLLLIIIIIWLNVTTFLISGLYLEIGKINHALVHVTFVEHK